MEPLRGRTHLVAIGVEKGFQIDYIGMGYETHDLQLAVLQGCMSMGHDDRPRSTKHAP